MAASEAPMGKEFKLDPDCELRFEVVTKNEKVTLELKSGLAELFGTELVKNKKYEFGYGTKGAVFTYHGCTVELTWKTDVPYTSKETPMNIYLNVHAALERLRNEAKQNDKRGPVTMIVGPGDVGKSTLCKILLNYAVRMGRRPIYVDIDVGQGHVGVPGILGAIPIERPADPVLGFSDEAPLAFHFGHKDPGANIQLYNLLVSQLAEACAERLEASKKAKSSGMIINTCGWVTGGGFKILTHAAKAFEVDAILVLDQEKLYNELVREIPDFVKVVFLPKSSGVVGRTQTARSEACDERIREYYYGKKVSLYPHSCDVKFNDAKIYKIGAPMLPTSCMPLGMKVEDNMTKLVSVTPGPHLLHHLLSVSFAGPTDTEIVQTNVAGFVCVTNVDMDRQIFTLLSPQPPPLPKCILLLSAVQFMDSQ